MLATSQPPTSARLIVHERLGLALLFALLIGVFIVLLPAPLLSLLGRSLSDRDGNFVGLANFQLLRQWRPAARLRPLIAGRQPGAPAGLTSAFATAWALDQVLQWC